jgi:hypothetical protein
MKQFFAALAMVSALLIVDSPKADETDKYCIYPKAEAVALLEQMRKEHGYKIVELKGVRAQAYFNVIREAASAPDLPGIELLILYNEGVAAFVVAVKGEFRCGHTAVNWPMHRAGMVAADRSSI